MNNALDMQTDMKKKKDSITKLKHLRDLNMIIIIIRHSLRLELVQKSSKHFP